MTITSSEYQKFSASPQATAPPYGQPVSGIPMPPPGSQYYGGNPQGMPNQSAPAGQWSSGLFDCFSDFSNCCLTFWCPCITFSQIAEIVDKGSTSCGTTGAIYTLIAFLTGCQCLYSCFYRTKLRQQYTLSESPCPNFCVHCCCEPCALCQEYRELESRGFDMSLGWYGNVEKQNRGVAMAPAYQGGMSR